MYAAGVLPICWIREQLYVLVGRDARDDTWSDFAGKCEKIDRDKESTAAREFWEESYGVLMDAKTMRSRLVPGQYIELQGRTQNLHPYYCFVTEIPFVPHLRDAFRKHLAFMRQRNVHRTYIEKTDIVYVSLNELFSDSFPKRSVFKETLLAHRDALHTIAAAGSSGFSALAAAARVPVTRTKSPTDLVRSNGPERDAGQARWQ